MCAARTARARSTEEHAVRCEDRRDVGDGSGLPRQGPGQAVDDEAQGRRVERPVHGERFQDVRLDGGDVQPAKAPRRVPENVPGSGRRSVTWRPSGMPEWSIRYPVPGPTSR